MEAGTAILVGTSKEKIVREASRLLTDQSAWESMSKINNPFGDGKSAFRIVDYIEKIVFYYEVVKFIQPGYPWFIFL